MLTKQVRQLQSVTDPGFPEQVVVMIFDRRHRDEQFVRYLLVAIARLD
jgi:hypothetical protein